MLTFMESLAQNPTGSSGVFGDPGSRPIDYSGPLSIVNQLKDREMHDYKNKALFDADLNARQGMRMRSLFNPDGTNQSQNQPQNTTSMNTVMAQDPNAMTGYQKGELGIRQQEVNMDSQRLAQTGKMGQQALDIKDAQQKLNEEKLAKDNEAKSADMERKINEANAKIELAQKALEIKDANSDAALKAQQAYRDAVEERHKLEMDMKQQDIDQREAAFQELKKQHQALLDQNANVETTTELNPDGTKKVVTTKKGSQANAPIKQANGTYKVTAPDGTTGYIPADKLDDWNTNHAGR